MNQLIELDHQVLVFLNNLGTPFLDPLFLFITHQINWLPLFLLIAYLLVKNIGWQKFGILLLILTLFFLFTDQMTNLVKNTTQRLRPVNHPDLMSQLRIIRGSHSYSFFSGHASNSSGAILIIFLLLKKHYKYAGLLFLFPLIFAYTRIYLGLHFLSDILVGYLFGISSGYLFYNIYLWSLEKIKKKQLIKR